jgi:hypothetical protein
VDPGQPCIDGQPASVVLPLPLHQLAHARVVHHVLQALVTTWHARHDDVAVLLAGLAGAEPSDFKVTARPAAVALGALTMAGRNNQDVMAR